MDRPFYKVLKIGHRSEKWQNFNHFSELKERYNICLLKCRIQKIEIFEKNFEGVGTKCGL